MSAPSRIFAGATGATAAYLAADQGGPTCRWPSGDPGTPGFRFCGAPVTVRTLPGADGLARPNVYCEACRPLARGQRQSAPFRAPMLGHSLFAGPRAVKAATTRHGSGR